MATDLVAPAGARRVIWRFVVWPSRLLVGLLAVAFAAGLHVPQTVQYLPFAASLVFFGLPHGAVDHLVPARLAGRAATLSSVLAVGALYLVLSGLYLALWFAASEAAFCLFIALTVFHWGAGDLHALLAFGPAGWRRTALATRVLVLLSRGGIPMLVPLLAFPGAYREVAGDATRIFGGGVDALAFAFSPAFRIPAGAALVGVALFSALYGARDLLPRRRRLILPYAAETSLLAFYFAVVPPVLAVGLYFCLWHSTRHVARLVLLDGNAAPPAVGSAAGRRFARDAAPLTAAALALLGGLFFGVPGTVEGPGSLLALYLVLVSSLTLPHATVVWYMDLRQGLWRRAKDRPGS